MEIIELIFYILEAFVNTGFWYFGEPTLNWGHKDVVTNHVKLFFNAFFYINFAILIIYAGLIYLYPTQYKNRNTYIILGITVLVIAIKLYTSYKHKQKDNNI